jgi:hypothetical protein
MSPPVMLVTRLLILILAAAVLLLTISVIAINVVQNLDSLLQYRPEKGSLFYGVVPPA